MGDKEKEEPAPNTKPGFQGKSGRIKKAYGRVLSSYKDRYVSVDKTEILIYEDEDQKNCLERVDLENYDRCHEMKSAFKKKHRLVLLRSPKPTNKVHDMKFQAQSAEEKEAWIKALSDGINRAKNKIFDEVKVDESSNLEHVTRSRPKGNRSRRPPTRIHMKEVADVSSDGILRLDLDLENAIMPNGTYSSTVVDGTENHNDASPSPSSRESTEDKPLSTIKEAEDQEKNQTEVLKPPMPPTKQATTIEEEAEEEEQERKTVKPLASPSKDMDLIETKTAKTPETSPDSRKKNPPMPPNKPLLSIITPQDPPPTKTPVPPPTPNKTMKPKATSDSTQEASENVEKEENSEKDISTDSENTPPTPEKSPELPTKHEDGAKLETPNEIVEGEKSKAEIPVVIVSLNDSQGIHLSPLLGHKQEGDENGKKLEEKSIDSGQHSDDNSVDSACEDALPIRDSLDELDSRDNSNIEVSSKLKPQISSTKGISWSKPAIPLKPQEKMRSVSTDNLLLESYYNIGEDMGLENKEVDVKRLENKEVDVKKLENEVATEMEDTSELLSRASRAQTFPRGDRNPENILAEALEKLKKADDVLREVKKLKLEKDVSHRKSW